MSEPSQKTDVDVSSVDSNEEISKLRRYVKQAIQHYCPGWLSDLKDDLAQIATMRVLEVSRRDASRRELSSAYIYRTAYSAVVDEIRRRRRRPEAWLEEQPASSVESQSGATPEDRLAAREIGEALKECLARLNRDRRLAVALHLHGHELSESAAILSTSRKRIENLVYRGLAALRTCLAARGVTP